MTIEPNRNRWKSGVRFSALALTLVLTAVAAPAGAGDDLGLGPEELAKKYNAALVMKKLDELMRGDTNYSEMRMTVHNPAWPSPRSYEMKSWEDRLGKKSFIRVTAPARDRGRAFLKDDVVFKVYVPSERENKPMTIPPSLMLQSWMGSDFTNDDLVRESSIVDDYQHQIEAVEKDEQGRLLLRVRMDPKPEAPVVWGKLVYWVDLKNELPTRQVYYDQEGVMVREMILSNVKRFGDRELPATWEMRSLTEDKKGRKTVLELLAIEFNVKIDPETFTEKNLTRRDWE